MTNKQVAILTILGGMAFILLIYSILMTIMCDDLIRKKNDTCVNEQEFKLLKIMEEV